jgi:hypothetical protein
MELSMQSRKEIIGRVYRRYQRATKSEKSSILGEFA